MFEEAAIDLGRAFAAYSRGGVGKRKGRRVGFPRSKRKGRCRDRFRLRNLGGGSGTGCIRVGQAHPRSVTLPRIGAVRVHEDTRRCGGCSERSSTLILAPGSRQLGPGPGSCSLPVAATDPVGM